MPHNHHSFFYFFQNRELNELYLTITIKSFALSMIGIFIPIYLLELGNSIASVLVFFVIVSGFHAAFSLPSAKLASRFGFKHSILWSRVLLIAALLLLVTLEMHSMPLFVPAIFLGISAALFWVGYHVDFSVFSDEKKRGAEVSVTQVVSSLFNVIGPLVSGLILLFFNFTVLFVSVCVLLVIGVIPLFYSDEIHRPIEFSFRRLFKGQKIRDTVSFLGFGFEHATTHVIWPVFLFTTIFVSEYRLTSVGLVTSVGLFFSFIFTFVIGRYADVRRRLVLKIGAISNAIVWGLKTLVVTPWHAFVADSLGGMTKTTLNIPFEAMSYDKAGASDIVKFIAYRETVINLGRAVLFAIMLVFVHFATSFIIGGSLGSLLQLFF